MNILKHIITQPFIAATGAAALVHSTWALGTLFAGEQPEGWHLLGWLLPALLIAFALDVGQIATSAEIRRHGLTPARGVTFAVFAAATYYLQWLYIAHHMPALALAPGVRESWSGSATLLRDAAVWIIPALLPLSTLLYTFSGKQGGAAPAPVVTRPERYPRPEPRPAVAEDHQLPAAPAVDQRPQLAEAVQEAPTPDVIVATCAACGWSKTYSDQTASARGLATHQNRHCTATHPVAHQNGHGHAAE